MRTHTKMKTGLVVLCCMAVSGLVYWAFLAHPNAAASEPTEVPAGAPQVLAKAEPAPLQWQDEVDGCRLYARVAKHSFASGEPAIVEVEFRNQSEMTVGVIPREPVLWIVRGTDQFGNELRPTSYVLYQKGKLKGPARIGSFTKLPVEPGRSITRCLSLDGLCDLTMPGTYSIQVGLIRGWPVVLQSQPIVIEVGQAELVGDSLSGALQLLKFATGLPEGQPKLPPTGYEPGMPVAEYLAEERVEALRMFAVSLGKEVAAVRELGLRDKSKNVVDEARQVLTDLAGQAEAAAAEIEAQSPPR